MKLFKKLAAPLLSVALCTTLLNGCSPAVKADITVNNTTFALNDTVQTLLDGGLFLCEIGGSEIDATSNSLPSMTYDYDSKRIGYTNADGENVSTGLVVYLYNPTSKEATYSECEIAGITYFYDTEAIITGDEPENESLIINGHDFSSMSPEEAASAFEEIGVSIDAEDKEEFTNSPDGYGHIYESSGSYNYELDATTITTNSGGETYALETLSISQDLNISFE